MESSIENKGHKIQTIFNKVIKAGIYPKIFDNDNTSNYMCNSLRFAVKRQIITPKEQEIAKLAIISYIRSTSTLSAFLERYYLPSDKTACLAIYQNWANRPKPEEA